MTCSWTLFFHRLARASLVSAFSAWSSAVCYAQIAADHASDPVYADGWQAGDNGGFGFTPWNFDTDFPPQPPASPNTHSIDSTSPHNDLGTAWTIRNTDASEPDGPPGGDVARAGRGFAPLEPGQTVSVVLDNPTERHFFRGYFVRLNTGGGNICFNDTPCPPGTTAKPKLNVRTFEYFSNGAWGVADGDPSPNDFNLTMLSDVDTDSGMQLDVELIGSDTYELTMTPFDDDPNDGQNPAPPYTQTGTLSNPGMGAIDWIEFTFFNTDSDFEPLLPMPEATDLYIRSLHVLPNLVGDMDRDRDVDFDDIDDFVLGLNNAVRYESTFGVPPMLKGDTDGDGDLDFDDIPGFVAILGGGGAQAVPEPATLGLAVLGAMGAAGLSASRFRKV